MDKELTAVKIEWALMHPAAQGSRGIINSAAFAYLRLLNAEDNVDGFVRELDEGTTSLLKDLRLDG